MNMNANPISLDTKVFNLHDLMDFLSCVSMYSNHLKYTGNYEILLEVFNTMDDEWQKCLDEKLDHDEAYTTTLFEKWSLDVKDLELHSEESYIHEKARTHVRKQFKPKKIRNNGKDAMMFEGLSIIACYIDISTTSHDHVSHEYINFIKEKMEAFANHHLQTDWDNEDFEDTVLQYWNLVCEPEFNRMFKKK